jgi:hypothetical protein
MKITRRKLAAVLAAPAALAQTPRPAADPLEAARQRIKANAETLAKENVPMPAEPAFQFKA